MKNQWQIIGAGAIGCLWAANLIKSGQSVHLVSRHKNGPQSITYQALDGESHMLDCPHSSQLVNSTSPILVCVKAPQVKQALLDQAKMISKQQVIILMHNGMGSAEQVAELLPNNPIICATTANACLLNGPLNISQTGLGISYLGPYNSQAQVYSGLAHKLNVALDNCHWCDDIEQKLWLKLVINVAINPLTAIHQVRNGALLAPFFQKQINVVIEELSAVINIMGIVMKNSELLHLINGVLRATAENYSSMNRDIFFKRPTENEYINGYLIKKALQHGIETPLITSFYQKIKVLENRSLAQLNTE